MKPKWTVRCLTSPVRPTLQPDAYLSNKGGFLLSRGQVWVGDKHVHCRRQPVLLQFKFVFVAGFKVIPAKSFSLQNDGSAHKNAFNVSSAWPSFSAFYIFVCNCRAWFATPASREVLRETCSGHLGFRMYGEKKTELGKANLRRMVAHAVDHRPVYVTPSSSKLYLSFITVCQLKPSGMDCNKIISYYFISLACRDIHCT